VFRFYDSIELSMKLRSTTPEVLGALCLVQNFRKLTEIQSSEVFKFSGELVGERSTSTVLVLYSRYSGVLVHLSTGLLVL
jgi:hypothetical protein